VCGVLDLEVLKRELYNAIVEGNVERALAAVNRLVESGVCPHELVLDVLVPAMRRVGELFETNEYSTADVIVCIEVFKAFKES
jgi:5-methyltetrahydrofolate--homocysteine methyltransferase